MICTTIQNRNLDEIQALLDSGDIEMAEIRLDRCPELSEEDIETVFSTTDIPLVATCRISDIRGSVATEREAVSIAEKKLKIAIEAGAKYMDLETEAPAAMGKRLRRIAKLNGTIFIRSYHDFNGTSDNVAEELERCRQYGADLTKIVTTAVKDGDVEKTMSLYSLVPEGQLIAFCMGEKGRESRMQALRMGAPYTYAALDESEAAAPGQWATADMVKALYSGSQDFHLGEVRMPASKSYAQRAIIAAALAEGTSRLKGYSPCADTESAVRVARALGAEVIEDEVLVIKGIGPAGPGCKPFGMQELHTGESGLLTRLMIPLMAMLNGEDIVVTGEKTLVNRPLKGANDIMAAFGVVLTNAVARDKNAKETYIPAKVSGRLIPGKADISGKGGSQLISGLLMALPMADVQSTIYISEPRSIPYMFITEDVLRKFGIKIVSEMEGGEDLIETQDWGLCTGMTFKIPGGQGYKAADIDLEGDWSSAANFLVAGAIFGSAQITGLDMMSLQADITIMDVLVEAGASISQIDTDYIDSVAEAATLAGVAPRTGNVCVAKAPLEPFEFDLNNAPDLFPIAAILAAFCPGTSRIGGTGRLSNKESDRGAAIVNTLNQMGVPARIEGDDLIIEGHSLSWRLANKKLLKGGEYTSYHDHRMVMALKVASLGADSPIVIDDEKCVCKSFPDFLTIFES